jgi:Tfp pilus assembly protein PilF
LLPEILTRKGENLLRLGQAATALRELEQAAELKPDYWAPYAYMSDYYKETGDLKKARELLETGLSHAPDAKGLKRRLEELDAGPTKGKNGQRPARPQQGAD